MPRLRLPRAAYLSFTALCISCVFFLSACEQQAKASLPTQKVLLADVSEQQFNPQSSYVGQVKAISDIAVRPKVSGYIKEIAFKEGQLVELGQLLFRIDARPFQSELNQANAQLSSSEANFIAAKAAFDRGQQLVADNYISQNELDELQARYLGTKASVDSAQAAVNNAKLNLDYTRITAAFAGRIGRTPYAVGDLVSPTDQALANLTSIDPIRIEFSISEKLFTHGQKLKERHQHSGKVSDMFNVWVDLDHDFRYPEPGAISYIANRVDTNTGTVLVRAELPNASGFLRPGMHATAVLETKMSIAGLFVPRVAVQADQQGNFVFVVDQDKVASKRYIELGDTQLNDLIHVEDGLELGERVVSKGLQRLRSGQTVDIEQAQPYQPSANADSAGVKP
ncbi:efflux RND transporter periplasmic adaptor subunit [Agaribacterium haliotis]|uniref:efflux RND transporter periplasmic adaptor subunit n=1 Tax=Agaribacterium haliotis TaxID=2013869 RepID=UPI000BB59E45|nr:efflux RND transporter periplasmic adaptor subunit [Agaribacterium haliotis]